ncbi:HAUS augmin-like complex subunit 1 [Madurella fahalii]|uniref:HAUS augmin-like complex subunit 1 n=1 Tax=Madurella fahalii TaxID=1157608 RepID=A0ABQ0GHL1_9PEZI
MAHLPPNAAIFSPSVARAAASAAKDWSYVDGWLSRKFPHGPPPFERNADTLRALLALASVNEAADEERALIARLEAEALSQLRAHEESQEDNNSNNTTSPLDDAREAILTALESSLTREGQTALDAMSALALQSGMANPTPSALGPSLIDLSTQSSRLDQALSRLSILTAYITREAQTTSHLSDELRPPSPTHHHHHHHHPSYKEGIEAEDDSDDDGDASDENPGPYRGYHPPASLALQNLSTQRRIKTLSARIPELQDKAAALAKSLGGKPPSPSIEQVRREEEAYLALLAQKRDLDAQVRAFQGLPPDTDQARHELESLRSELRRMTIKRDEVFEGLVERESPRKPARR